MLPTPPLRVVAVGLCAAALCGCGAVQVRSVGTNTGHAAFDLVGPSLQVLGAEASRLCPQGHAVMRQWQRGTIASGQGDATASASAAMVALSYDLQPDQAQMSIVCRA